MPATDFLSCFFKINPRQFTRLECLILEAELFVRICEELAEIYEIKNKNYFSLIKKDNHQEDAMVEAKFLGFVIKDILSTEEYSLEGIAYYTQLPEEIVCDIVSGNNQMPSLQASQKIIELHRSVRPDLYRGVIKKITTALSE